MGCWRFVNVVFAKEPDVFAVFVVFKSQPSKLLLDAQRLIALLLCLSTLFIYIWVVRTNWKMPRLDSNILLKYRIGAASYILLLIVLSSVGMNLIHRNGNGMWTSLWGGCLVCYSYGIHTW